MFLLEIVAAVVAIAIVAVLLLAAGKPDTFRVERTLEIRSAPEAIFASIVDFRQWVGWSPWEGIDPGMAREYDGTPEGQGAVYRWSGNGKVGAGTMEITRVRVPTSITLKLDFERPFEAHNTTEFTLVPVGGSTRVTWAMSGPNRFLAKVFHVFLDMDRMVGKDFEKGLHNLKTLAEK
jgi:uncharacterized protein YndB with AHSA1/START domain